MQSDFLYLVENELAEARESTPVPIDNLHEAYGAIGGKVVAFGIAISQSITRTGGLDYEIAEMLKGLVQIAATCYRAAEDLQLLEVEMTQEFVNAVIAKHMPDHAICDHKGLRFRADDPNQEKLGMSRNHKCLHGVEWTITGPCLDALSTEQFPTHCDCSKDDPNLDICPRCGSMVAKSLGVICPCPQSRLSDTPRLPTR